MIQFLVTALFLVIVIGLLVHGGVELPWFLAWVGKLPGDILVKKGNVTIYVPITSSLLVSAVLSLLFSFFSRGGRSN